MILDQLRLACARRGIEGEAFDREFRSYVEVGTLSAGDRTVLDGICEHLSRGDSLVWLRRRFGPKALRVAVVAWEERIGGVAPTPHASPEELVDHRQVGG